MKEVYTALESIEGGEKLVELVKASVQERADYEKENRSLKAENEQYKELDIATLKAYNEFVENAGGIDSLQSAIAKAEGYDTNEEKLKQKQDEYEALKKQHESDSENFSKRLEESNLKAELLPQFVDAFEGSNVLLDHAMSRGMVGTSENGLYFKDGDSITPFSAGGFDKLKEHGDFSFALKKPSGGNEGAGSGSGGITSAKPKTLADSLNEAFSS